MATTTVNINELSLTHQNIKSRRWRNIDFGMINLDGADATSSHIRLCTFVKLSALQTNFRDLVFENNRIHGGSFHFCDFINASLIESDFSRSSFEGTNLNNTDLEDCNLRGVDFRCAIVVNTSFRGADLRGADFSGAQIESADFTGADLRGAIFDTDVEAALFGAQKSNQPPTELIDAVSPIVASLLKQAERNGAVSDDKWRAELQQTLATIGASPLDENTIDLWDQQVSFWLNQAGKIGVNDLLESLRSDDEKPPAAIVPMLEGFIKELGLQPGTSTQELVEVLFAKLQKPDASCDK